jgi:acyl carrier protein
VGDHYGSLEHGNKLTSMTTANEYRPVTDQAIYEKLTSIFRTVLDDNSIILHAETSESDIAGWDSFNNASLIAAIEKEFAIRFRTAELQSLRSVGSFVEIIRAKLQGRS